MADFRQARRLEPHYAGIPLEEGIFWRQTQPELTLIAWREALRRVSSPEDEIVFGTMLTIAPDDPVFRSRLLQLAQGRPPLQLAWFQCVPADEARAKFDEISASCGLLTMPGNAPLFSAGPSKSAPSASKRRSTIS